MNRDDLTDWQFELVTFSAVRLDIKLHIYGKYIAADGNRPNCLPACEISISKPTDSRLLHMLVLPVYIGSEELRLIKYQLGDRWQNTGNTIMRGGISVILDELRYRYSYR